MHKNALLEMTNLNISFNAHTRPIRAVRNVSFSIMPGEVVALVGESGSGKSTIGLAIMQLIEQAAGLEVAGKVEFNRSSGETVNLMTCTDREMQNIRGNEVAMIFQEPMSSLNPIFTIGDQIVEAIRAHRNVSKSDAGKTALEMITMLGVPNPSKCLASYPFQLSGGMRQRVMIAMALACNPRLLIADEPTTALDVTIQAQIVEHLKGLQERLGMSMLFITHDLGLVSEIADRVLVMYAGQVVEVANVRELFATPLMPYTAALMESMPRLGCSSIPNYRIQAITGNVPNPMNLPTGCAFHPRCRHNVASICETVDPTLDQVDDRRMVRCLRWQEITGRKVHG